MALHDHTCGCIHMQQCDMGTLRKALDETLNAHVGDTKDKAVRALALMYAEAIDDEEIELKDGGPKLLQCLDALLLTPKSRRIPSALKDSDDQPARSNPLDQLRAKRAAR